MFLERPTPSLRDDPSAVRALAKTSLVDASQIARPSGTVLKQPEPFQKCVDGPSQEQRREASPLCRPLLVSACLAYPWLINWLPQRTARWSATSSTVAWCQVSSQYRSTMEGGASAVDALSASGDGCHLRNAGTVEATMIALGLVMATLVMVALDFMPTPIKQ